MRVVVSILLTAVLALSAAAEEVTSRPLQIYNLGKLEFAIYSPDGRYLLTGGSMNPVLWDVQTRKVVRIFWGHTYFVVSAAFTSDGNKVLTGSGDGQAILWNVADGRILRVFPHGIFSDWVYGVDISPDETKVLTKGTRTKIWNMAEATLIREFPFPLNLVEGNEAPIPQNVMIEAHDAVFTSDSQHVAIARTNGLKAYVFRLSDGALVQTFSGITGSIETLTYSRDGSKLLAGCSDGKSALFDARTSAVLRTFTGQSQAVAAAFSADESHIATGGYDGRVKLWRLSDGREVRTISGHQWPINSVGYSPDNTRVLSAAGSVENRARLWSVANGTSFTMCTEHAARIGSVAISPDGKTILVGNERGAELWDLKDRRLVRTIKVLTFGGIETEVDFALFSVDGTKILTAGFMGGLRLFRTSDGSLIREFPWEASGLMCVAWSRDGSRIATGYMSGDVKIWNANTGALLRTITDDRFVKAVALTSDGTKVLSGVADIKMWNTGNGSLIRTFSSHSGDIGSLAFSADETRILSAASDGTAKIWDVSDASVIRTFISRGFTRAIFSPDERYVLTGDFDAKLWDASDGTHIRTYDGGFSHNFNSLAFSPDGTRFVSGGQEGMVMLWPTDGRLPSAARVPWRLLR